MKGFIEMAILMTGIILSNRQSEVVHRETNKNNTNLSQNTLEVLIKLLTKLKSDSDYQELFNQLFN
jgi:hypothetical protein